MDGQRTIGLLGRVAAVAALLTIVTTVGGFLGWLAEGGNSPDFQIFFCTPDGFPRTNLAIETPGGVYYTDTHGRIPADDAWVGHLVMIHDAKSWQLMSTETVNRIENERVVRVVVNDGGPG